MADGRNTVLCAGGLSMVFALAAAFPAFRFNAAARDLDSQHHPNLLRLAFAQAGTTMVGSWLDPVAGIWKYRNRRHPSLVAQLGATIRAAMLN